MVVVLNMGGSSGRTISHWLDYETNETNMRLLARILARLLARLLVISVILARLLAIVARLC